MSDVPRRLPPTHEERLKVALGMSPGSNAGGTRFARPVPSSSSAALTRAIIPTQQPEGNGWWPDGWVQLPLVVVPMMTATHAVYSDPAKNYVAVKATGAFTVDWGDGSAPVNYTSGTLATHQYAWADISPSTLAPGGWRQALIALTPQPGQTFNLLDLTVRHPSSPAPKNTGWTALTVCGPMVSTLLISWTNPHPLLAQFRYVGPSSLTDVSQLFQGLPVLQSVVGTEWTANANNVFQLFALCGSLTAVDLLDTHSAANFTGMFNGCTNLTSIPLLDTHAGTAFGSMFLNCFNLQAGTLAGTNASISYAGCALPAAALNDIFTHLATVTGKTITITGNPGAATCDRSIATGRGWTVVG